MDTFGKSAWENTQLFWRVGKKAGKDITGLERTFETHGSSLCCGDLSLWCTKVIASLGSTYVAVLSELFWGMCYEGMQSEELSFIMELFFYKCAQTYAAIYIYVCACIYNGAHTHRAQSHTHTHTHLSCIGQINILMSNTDNWSQMPKFQAETQWCPCKKKGTHQLEMSSLILQTEHLTQSQCVKHQRHCINVPCWNKASTALVTRSNKSPAVTYDIDNSLQRVTDFLFLMNCLLDQ